jgi:ABC-2 type transport system permease protein
MMIFTAFYESTTRTMPMTLEQTVTYVWLGQALLLLMPWNMDAEIAGMVRTGNVAYELVRPVSVYWLWFCRSAAMRIAPVFLRAVPMFVVAGLFLGLKAPPSFACGCAFIASVFAAWLLSAAFTTVLATTLFWTVSGEGIVRIAPSFFLLFSGLFVPLPLFPDWAQPILNALPFRGLMDVPFRLYMGHIPPSETGWLVLHQLAWMAAIVMAGQAMAWRGLRRAVVQGG